MIIGHLTGWWIRTEEFSFLIFIRTFFDVLGSGAFLFVAGISTMISYRDRIARKQLSEQYNKKIVRNEYIFRALIILIIALMYNTFNAIGYNRPLDIWKWFILFTMAISLFITWPLLKMSKLFRIFLGGIFWIANCFTLTFLIEYNGQFNLYGVLFHIFYNSLDLDPILSFFTFFLIGTVVGDTICDIYLMENQSERRIAFKKKFLIPSLLLGAFLIIFGILFPFPVLFPYSGLSSHFIEDIFPDVPAFLQHRSFSWLIYSLGVDVIIFSILLAVEEFEIIKTKSSFNFIFYFSYYSLDIYLAHYLFYFIFLGQLNLLTTLICVAITIVLLGIALKIIHVKWKGNASLKFIIGKVSTKLAKKIS